MSNLKIVFSKVIVKVVNAKFRTRIFSAEYDLEWQMEKDFFPRRAYRSGSEGLSIRGLRGPRVVWRASPTSTAKRNREC